MNEKFDTFVQKHGNYRMHMHEKQINKQIVLVRMMTMIQLCIQVAFGIDLFTFVVLIVRFH